MGVQARISFIETVGWNALHWEDIDIDKAREWLKNREMPKSVAYPSVGNLLFDIRKAKGVITLRKDESKELVSFLENLFYDVL